MCVNGFKYWLFYGGWVGVGGVGVFGLIVCDLSSYLYLFWSVYKYDYFVYISSDIKNCKILKNIVLLSVYFMVGWSDVFISKMLLLFRFMRGENGGLERLNYFSVIWSVIGRFRIKVLFGLFLDFEFLIFMFFKGFEYYLYRGVI